MSGCSPGDHGGHGGQCVIDDIIARQWGHHMAMASMFCSLQLDVLLCIYAYIYRRDSFRPTA